MKKGILVFACSFLFFPAINAQSFIKKIAKKVKEKVEQKTDQKIEEKTDMAASKIVNMPDSVAAKAEKEVKAKLDAKKNSKSANRVSISETDTTVTTLSTPTTANSNSIIKAYGSYDFIPGNTVYLSDDLKDEEADDIPSKWILSNGRFEVINVEDEKAIAAYSGLFATPRMKKGTTLPKKFTIEFDIKFTGITSLTEQNPDLFFVLDNYKTVEKMLATDESGETKRMTEIEASNYTYIKNEIIINATGSAKYQMGNNKSSEGRWPGLYYEDKDAKLDWRHIAISVNEKGLKLYMNQYRLLNIQLEETNTPTRFAFSYGHLNSPALIKNFRIMEGGKDPAKQLTTEKIYIARGIQFDLGKASLRPESMGEINKLVQLMKDNPDLIFEIGGHTSKENNNASKANQLLSEQRANTVMQQMTSMGIEAERLTAKGFGETKPIAANDTPEGRASNRRVEFVKQ